MARYLITGGFGYIGQHLATQLLALGNDVTLVDRGSVDVLRNTLKQSSARLEIFQSDLSDVAWLTGLMKNIDVCFHLASPASDSVESYMPSERAADIAELNFNSAALLNAIQPNLVVFESAVLAGNVPVIFSSTDSVYGSSINFPLNEKTLPMPISNMGLLKYQIEQYARHYNIKYGLPVSALRIFNVYGSWCEGWDGDVITRFCKAALDKQPLTLFGHGNQDRDFIHIRDVVTGFIRTAEAKLKGFNTFNLCTSESTTLNALVDILSSLMGYPMELDYLEYRRGELHNAVGCIQKMQRQIGFRAGINIVDGLRQVLNDAGAITLQQKRLANQI